VIAVCVDANSWNSYRGGIMTSCGQNVDHCVQIVGYGSSGSTDYWKVRNSWGGSWGEGGHVRVQIGRNLCDISGEPSAVTASAVGPSPSPSPTPTPTPTPMPTPTPSPTPSGNCRAISGLVDDDWCTTNCHAGFCPRDLCECDSTIVA